MTRRAPRGAVAMLALLASVSACNSLPGKPTQADLPLRPEQVVDFNALYGTDCAGCHGADGTLGAARPLNDAIYLALVGTDRLRQIIANGVPDTLMPGFGAAVGGTLTTQQIDIIAQGMQTRWGGAAPGGMPAYAAGGPGDAQRGAAAYAAYCAGCHGADGKGGPKGASVVDGSYLALVSDQALRSAVICGRPDLGMPDWRGDAAGKPMSEQDVTNVVAWLTAQRAKFPGQPYGGG